MSGPVGHTFLYNLIIFFIIVIFAFISGTLSYYKAFKVNNKIIYAIEKYEGYNKLSKEEIDRILGNLGYSLEDANCKENYKKMYLINSVGENYDYCVYIENERPAKNTYFYYGVLTYMKLDLPIINVLNIPVFTRTNKIYKFTTTVPLE